MHIMYAAFFIKYMTDKCETRVVDRWSRTHNSQLQNIATCPVRGCLEGPSSNLGRHYINVYLAVWLSGKVKVKLVLN
jgi:hypothetical protein